jgi:glycosyltransferase involved in cell wall biosynthesis
MRPLVVLDADVLGRRRTGDETYVQNLLRALPAAAPDLRFAAITRRPDLVPPGVEPVELRVRVQELRMAAFVPLLVRRLGARLAHFQHALPLVRTCPSVVTIHDLSFEQPGLMGRKDRLMFRTFVPRAARTAERVFVVSERTRDDVLGRYGVRPERVVVTPNGVDPAFGPGEDGPRDYVLLVGAIQERKNPLAALEAAAAAGLPLVVVGPEKDPALARELERRGAQLRGYVEQDELARLYRGAAVLIQPSRYEGFGLTVVEAMASGTPVVAVREPALQEVGGDAAIFADEAGLAGAIRQAVAERERWSAAGLERARAFSWDATAERTVQAYREVLGLAGGGL